MGRLGRKGILQIAAEAQAGAAREAWTAHLKLCYRCHAAGGRPGLFCDGGFRLAQAVTRTARAVEAARGGGGGVQGMLP